MQLGFFTAILNELPLTKVVDFAAKNRFACLEVACWPTGRADRKYAGITHIDVVAFTQSKADEVKGYCLASGVGISALGFYPNPLDPAPAVSRAAMHHLKKVMLAAEQLGVKNVNTFVGRDWTKTVDENWPSFL